MANEDGEAAGMSAAAVPDDEILPPVPAPEAPEAEESDAEAASAGGHDDGGGGTDNIAGEEEPAVAVARPAPPGAAGLVPHVVSGRRRVALPMLDLDQLKSQRKNLKRQLRECTKSVKAQAWLLDRAPARYLEISFVCRCRNKKGAACSKRLEI